MAEKLRYPIKNSMKRLLALGGLVICMASCGGDAHDGDANTDTSNMSPDGSMYGTDTSLNTNTGTYGTGTNTRDSFASRGTDPASRKTTPGNRDSAQ